MKYGLADNLENYPPDQGYWVIVVLDESLSDKNIDNLEAMSIESYKILHGPSSLVTGPKA